MIRSVRRCSRWRDPGTAPGPGGPTRASVALGGSEALADGVLRQDPRLDELEQVVGAPGLGAHARHAVAAEGLAADQGAGDAPVDVEVAGPELLGRPGDPGRGPREQTAR